LQNLQRTKGGFVCVFFVFASAAVVFNWYATLHKPKTQSRQFKPVSQPGSDSFASSGSHPQEKQSALNKRLLFSA